MEHYFGSVTVYSVVLPMTSWQGDEGNCPLRTPSNFFI